MVSEPPIIADAGPLIALSRIDNLNLLQQAFGSAKKPDISINPCSPEAQSRHDRKQAGIVQTLLDTGLLVSAVR